MKPTFRGRDETPRHCPRAMTGRGGGGGTAPSPENFYGDRNGERAWTWCCLAPGHAQTKIDGQSKLQGSNVDRTWSALGYGAGWSGCVG